MNAGKTTDSATGGYVSVSTGYSSRTSSGPFSLRTPNAGGTGVSGEISISTGTSSAGNTGAILMGTGEATAGHGGDVRIRVGTGHSDDGGNILISAGETTAAGFTGGNVVITAGEGSSTYTYDGGDGGVVQIFGGAGQGGMDEDDGGNVEVSGGYARVARGGSFLVRTGFGETSSSGIIDIATANAGQKGVSGDIDLSTGTSSLGNTGYINIETGEATNSSIFPPKSSKSDPPEASPP